VQAKFPGRCAVCAEPIRPGDSIARPNDDPGAWVHAACRLEPKRRAVKAAMVAPPGAVAVYTDGACSGNPGPGGWAWAVDQDTWRSGNEAPSTNQRMEIRAALEAVTALEGPLLVVSDSTYVVNCFRDRWWAGWLDRSWTNSQKKPVANRDLWEPLVRAVIERGDVAFHWVKGHSGHEMNDFVDQLAVRASLSKE